MQGYDNPSQGYYQPQPHGYAQPQPHGYVQPQQQQQTVVMVNQPQSQFPIQGQPQNIRQWTTGMCGCCEDCCGCKTYFTLDNLFTLDRFCFHLKLQPKP